MCFESQAALGVKKPKDEKKTTEQKNSKKNDSKKDDKDDEDKTQSETEPVEKPLSVITSKVNDNQKFDIVNPTIAAWLKTFKIGAPQFYGLTQELSYPIPVRLKWKVKGKKAKKYIISISTEKKNLPSLIEDTDKTSSQAPLIYKTKRTFKDVYNLKTGEVYYWNVTAKYPKKKVVISDTFRFRTKPGLRTLKILGVSNVRDMGGWKVEGGRIKEGLIYRSGNVDAIYPGGKNQIQNDLGIKTDFDLRKAGEGTAGTTSPLGTDVKYVNLGGVYYNNIIQDELNYHTLVKEFKVLAYEKNYPILFHCAIGRDRTGTLAFLLMSLLGASKKDMYREYELSNFSIAGCTGKSQPITLEKRITRVYDLIDKHGKKDNTFAEKTELFLIDAGVSRKTIKKLKQNLIEFDE